MKKKKSPLKKILIILGVLFAAFIIWVWVDDDEDFNDDTDTHYVASTTGASQVQSKPDVSPDTSAANNTADQNELFTSLELEGIVRNKQVVLKGDGTDKVTILMYMNGSDLESESEEATTDLTEMVAGMKDGNVNLIIQTMNTKKWASKYGISNKRTERYEVTSNGLKLVDDSLPQLSCTVSDTLSDYIKWGVANYPADRYILLFWNHGGGPVYGFGYDDKTESDDMLSIDEMQTALKDAGVFFDFIGMDCCLMSCMELCCSVYDYCDYCILSEDFESGYGWYYTDWLSALCANSSIPTPQLAKKIIDGMVSYNEKMGQDAILALVDESYMKVLFTSWIDFAFANDDSLFDTNYSKKTTRSVGGRVHPVLYKDRFFSDFLDSFGDDDYEMADYYITDIMALASTINSDESAALEASVNRALPYVNSCNGSKSLTGISVTLPYGDSSFYDELETVFTNCGFDPTYIGWLKNFVTSSGYDSYYDYDDWDDSWCGWDCYEDDYDWCDWGGCFGSNWDDEYYDYYGCEDGSCWDSWWSDDDWWWFDDDYDNDDWWDDDWWDDDYDDYYDDWDWNR